MRLATGATHERDTREKAPRRFPFLRPRPYARSRSLLARRFLSERPISATSFIRETRGRSRIHKRRGKRLVDRYADFSRANNDREIAHARFCGLSCGLMRSRGWNFKPIYLSITIVQLRLLSRLSYAVPSFEYFCQPFSRNATRYLAYLVNFHMKNSR